MAQSSSAASQAPPPAKVPRGCRHLDKVDIVPDAGVSRVSRQLLEGCIRRTFTSAAQVTQLIHQGADPRAFGGMCVRSATGSSLGLRWRYSCLSFAIDSPANTPFLYARGARNQEVPVVLPQWSSGQLQRDVINALIDGGANINGGGLEQRVIRVAVRAGNLTAVEALLARQANVQGVRAMGLPYFDGDTAPPATREYEDILMSIYRRLLEHDSTLAAERSFGANLVHMAVSVPSIFSQLFIDQYLTLITSHVGADTTATDNFGCTPLHLAASFGSYYVAEWLCRQLTAGDVNRGKPNHPDRTPLAEAAQALDSCARHQYGQGEEERRSGHIRKYKTIIGMLLRTGAAPSIARMLTATEEQRRCRQLVLTEYATVLNELSEVVMSAINAALAPQRDHSMLLAQAIGWKIGAFLHDPSAAVAAIDQYLTGESPLRRRVGAAVGHFVKSAATQTSSNKEVVGGTRHEQQGDKRVKVTVPPLQCFRVGGVGGRRLGVREVVHRARLDEAQYGVMGVVKGFNEHLGY
ncbi:unnamed protein product [Vitrella brassicaformis CCMP3155]|uniref:Uncharacterized protein n=1 Tax=Vitrella brassicaformis (strain CCMP3155) TaxID=1169540 RepID=A0A0G4GBI3_VITBC|nr:unnamed protein product [Vitrella brassicaformis CCMP3155]|eukprot:CEM26341.1 unnamed protein product [Vitrella brassicaformis CCMP3155]